MLQEFRRKRSNLHSLTGVDLGDFLFMDHRTCRIYDVTSEGKTYTQQILERSRHHKIIIRFSKNTHIQQVPYRHTVFAMQDNVVYLQVEQHYDCFDCMIIVLCKPHIQRMVSEFFKDLPHPSLDFYWYIYFILQSERIIYMYNYKYSQFLGVMCAFLFTCNSINLWSTPIQYTYIVCYPL